jgi:hypothetical protein
MDTYTHGASSSSTNIRIDHDEDHERADGSYEDVSEPILPVERSATLPPSYELSRAGQHVDDITVSKAQHKAE